MKIAAAVVTYNRLELLKRCIGRLQSQSRPPDEIIVINNDSTDGTKEWLDARENIRVIHQANLGGAGGFNTALTYAMQLNVDWVWAMDDDCFPDTRALEELLAVNPVKDTIYGSVALNEQDTRQIVWWIADERNKGEFIREHDKLHSLVYPTRHTIPFLGIFVPDKIIKDIGYPQKELVLWNDDEEYCYRAMSKGYKLCYAVKSVLLHPPVSYKKISVFFLTTFIYATTYQKNRYFFRNSTFVAKKYHSFSKFVFLILPLKVIKAYIHAYHGGAATHRFKHFRLYLSAIIDGITGKLGSYS